MAREPRKTVGASVRARLLDRSRVERTDFQILLTRYALERLLYRLSLSPHRDRFILKGAMLFVTWVADPFRPTRDLDFLGYGENSPDAIGAVFREICGQPVDDDGLEFDIGAITAVPIREDIEYGGIRVRTSATIAGARVPIQVDIGFGDAVTPGPVEIEYPSLLDAPAPRLRAYPVTTVVAEKFQALVQLGIANSRLKDFYDLWLIAQTFEFDRVSLAEAVHQTFARRETMLPTEKPIGLSDAYVEAWGRQWRAFLGRERMASAPTELTAVVSDLAGFLLPLIEPAERDQRWKPSEGWSASNA
ncbi:nucleotidyl transferase AbiEii/AbiGii toxin family protein [Kaistia dalseonensis]|uniref:Nucleotidyltransferase component of viral defense system n=1 Tax=Kaistia dalseonensis TaxID=410840 RepID=A0ABU0H2F3_9HYPH|nr:nucleotidyl transferase AbiEii/AbiGii toxin family protein [Kaistia dalseonensis]MCX5493923.1 nucleotidyl transferase AbiEii/AbiGii toxin family protein [Kaistia dalseonensis]MDQ0436493.1 putative nucleotidyltransferase component of viral defense system [Kaistia dalseonensis]